MKAEMVPGRPLYIRGVSYWIPDLSELRLALANTMGVPMNSFLRSYLEKQEREYENSIPAGDVSYDGEATSNRRTYSRKDSSVEKKGEASKNRKTEKNREPRTTETPKGNSTVEQKETRKNTPEPELPETYELPSPEPDNNKAAKAETPSDTPARGESEKQIE